MKLLSPTPFSSNCSCQYRSRRTRHTSSLVRSAPRDELKGVPPPSPEPSLLDPVQTIAWGGTLPSTRRAVLSILTGSLVVLGGNLGGVTTQLLGLDGGKLAKQLQLDALIPVNASPVPYKRCIDGRWGYEFTFPASWLADQTVAYRAAQRAEASRSLDLPPIARTPMPGRKVSPYEPVVAYGPAGSSGEENISVIVAPIYEGFTLASMGSPERVASQFLATTAPEGSGRTAALFATSRREDPMGQLYYEMEYTIKGAAFFRHNLSVITSRNNLLYTFNAQVSEDQWQRDEAMLRASALSFSLTTSRLNASGFPDQI